MSACAPAVHLAVIDNYDSFTYNLVQLLHALGARCEVFLNDQQSTGVVLDSRPDGLLISPGPGAPEQSGITLDVLRVACGKVPVLGVCLGHQAVATHFGARVARAPAPVHGKADAIRHNGRGLFRTLPSPFLAGRYHSLVVDESTLPRCLDVTARSSDGLIMALEHTQWPIHSVQFHPESILSEHGTRLLGNWLEGL